MKTILGNIKKTNQKKAAIEAKDWIMRLTSEPLTSEDQVQLSKWLNQNPLNVAEFEIMRKIWDITDVLENNPTAMRLAEKPSSSKSMNIFPFFKLLAVAASILMVIGGIWLMQKKTPTPDIHQTGIGEQSVVYLADGSIINLDTQTVVKTSITKELRQVILEEGQAIFSVAHDSSRPFVVTAGEISVQAIGTVFNVVMEKHGNVSVAVTEGSVQVTRENGDLQAEVKTQSDSSIVNQNTDKKVSLVKKKESPLIAKKIVKTGQEIVIEKETPVYKMKAADIKRINARKKGKLRYRLTPLEEIVTDINRYTKKKMVIGDESLKGLHASMIFNISDTQYFLQTLEKTIPSIGHYETGSTIVLVQKFSVKWGKQ